jgi:hypothetical protein
LVEVLSFIGLTRQLLYELCLLGAQLSVKVCLWLNVEKLENFWYPKLFVLHNFARKLFKTFNQGKQILRLSFVRSVVRSVVR